MKALLISFVVLSLSFSMFAQEPTDPLEAIHDNPTRANLIGRAMAEGMHDMLPYYTVNNPVSSNHDKAEEVDYQQGKIIDKDFTTYQFEGAFFVHANEVAIKTESSDLHLIHKDKINGVQLGEDQYISLAMPDERTKGKLYKWMLMQPLSLGEYSLFALPIMKEVKKSATPVQGTRYAESEFVTDYEYYYTSQKRPTLAIPVPKKKGDLIEVFRSNRSKVIEYAKSSKLSPRKEEDLISLFSYYNLLEQ